MLYLDDLTISLNPSQLIKKAKQSFSRLNKTLFMCSTSVAPHRTAPYIKKALSTPLKILKFQPPPNSMKIFAYDHYKFYSTCLLTMECGKCGCGDALNGISVNLTLSFTCIKSMTPQSLFHVHVGGVRKIRVWQYRVRVSGVSVTL